jgi:lactoylglutathione lyase
LSTVGPSCKIGHPAKSTTRIGAPHWKVFMFSHVFVGVTDFARALAFYEPLLAALGLKRRFRDDARPWAGWQPESGDRPLFLVGHPFDGNAHAAGNGQMVAFLAPNRRLVDEVHEIAVSRGGRSEGAAGLRPDYHADYYAAYFRDPDGNKLCVVCHGPAPAASFE